MKHVVRYGLAVVGIAFAAATSADAQAQKIGWINMQRIQQEAPGVAEARTALQAEQKRYAAQVDSLENNIERLQADLQRQQASLTPAVRQQREQELQQRFTAAQQQVAQIQQTAQKRQAELFGPISQRIEQAVEAIRKEGNYVVILEAGTLAAADPAAELTTRVLERLRQPAR